MIVILSPPCYSPLLGSFAPPSLHEATQVRQRFGSSPECVWLPLLWLQGSVLVLGASGTSEEDTSGCHLRLSLI